MSIKRSMEIATLVGASFDAHSTAQASRYEKHES